MDLLTSILFATVVAGTPLLLVALGELVCEKSGMLNLGAEGMMSVGAVAAFVAAFTFESTLLGVTSGILAGALLSLVFAFITVHLMANQVATGLAVAIFGVGLAAFLGKPFEAKVLTSIKPTEIPFLSELPFIGPALFGQQWIVYVTWAIFAAVVWFLAKTRGGLVLKAVGESPDAANSIGIDVIKVRYLAILFGGAMAGLGGAFLSLFHTPMWAEGMVAGKGWIALALVVFATWRPWRVLFGAYLFGGVMISQLFVQSSPIPIKIPAQFLSALPYIATIVVLVLISRNVKMIRLNSPASLGKPFQKERA
ncbi:MAG: ABC transporter permease [Burkholderiaceae bacterium]|nr:ABC transporter permease [Burkholderiaceae bacterium]MCD8518155.1 ABC transporter permease [Burkholderiaceae bacterium]MCD8537740.1 ABC transporter permease [Burkholderiaceae bacterium]MCD8564159.1 ABC transporter permease [Burkholderiaceae bacterium]